MMDQARIYSLSTVGLLKHYNQDYLLHKVRTDFTGNNGVGKSIIADLMQLIFISDKGLVVFGTEGLKKGDRRIHSLPYGCTEAYAFLNVEVKKDLFVVIGVCIPSAQSRWLRSFIILNTANDQGTLDEIGIPKNKLITWRNFIDRGKIPVIEDLAKHLRDNHQVYLKYYSHKEDKNDYYSFLFNRKILPINLSIADNLQTFARIIQSFSRARSLDVNNSTSLKKFLFEDSEKQFAQLFQSHKRELERLLGDFKSLKDYIEDLESKQADLISLKQKESKRTENQRTYLQTELDYLFQVMNHAEVEHRKIAAQVEADKARMNELIERSPRLKSLIKKSTARTEQAESLYSKLEKFREDLTTFASINREIQNLEGLKLHKIDEDVVHTINPLHIDTPEIVRRVSEFNPVFEKYKSVSAIDQFCAEQSNGIEKRKSVLKSDIQAHEEIIKLIEYGKEKTLFEQVIKAGKPLSAEQEIALMSLLKVSWGRPEQTVNGVAYTDSLDVLDEKLIEPTKDGFWLKFGHLVRFYQNTDKKRVLSNANALKNAVKEKLSSTKEAIELCKAELGELEKFQRGLSFDSAKVKLSFSLDQRLRDFSSLDYLKGTAKIIREMANKIAELKQRQQAVKKNVDALKQVLPTVNQDNIESYTTSLKRLTSMNRARTEKLSNLSLKEETTIHNLKKDILPMRETSAQEKQVSFNRAKTDYINKLTRAENIFPNIQAETKKEQLTIKIVDSKWEDFTSANVNYVTDYKTIAGRYEDSRIRKNAEIHEQLKNETYGFPILERVLLGPKIKHIDNIGNELRTSNQERLTMMETIHETMLKIFSQTKSKFEDYKNVVRDLNSFFKGKKISNRYYFVIQFKPQKEIDIEWITKLQTNSQRVFKKGEIPFGDTVERYVEDFFQKATSVKKPIAFAELLDPKTYFDLSVSLTDENNKEIPGSTGETYSAIVLLGIGRLSIVQGDRRPGVKFIILEEMANLDKVNFNTFPNIANEFGYQIITMTPKPYGSDGDEGWYLHHMFPGVDNSDINYPDVASYFKTNEDKKDLKTYLSAIEDK